MTVLELIDVVLIYNNLQKKMKISLSANHSRYVIKPVQIAEVLVVLHTKALKFQIMNYGKHILNFKAKKGKFQGVKINLDQGVSESIHLTER